MNSIAAPSPFLTLSAVIHGLRGAVGGWAVRGLLSTVLGLLLYRRLGEICRRMERLAVRFQAGRLRRRAPGARPGGAGGARGRVAGVWPGRFGWLVRAASYQAAGYGCQLRAVLETPEMVALLEASPQAVRILRPLCRMLAIENSVLRPGLAGETVSAVASPVVRTRVRAKRPPVDLGRIPLPRGVLSWARRQGFGKVPRD